MFCYFLPDCHYDSPSNHFTAPPGFEGKLSRCLHNEPVIYYGNKTKPVPLLNILGLHYHVKTSFWFLSTRSFYAYLFPLLLLFYHCQHCCWIAVLHAFFSSPTTPTLTTTTSASTCRLCSLRALWVICIDHSLCSHLLANVVYKEW